jgi:hypothetical protein
MGIPYHLLHDTATIQTPTQSTDSAGSPTTTYSGTATVACRVDADSSQDAARYMRETGLRRSTGYFPPTHTDGTALTLNKTTRVVVGSVTYRVVGPATNAADVEVLQVVTLEEDT